MEVPRRSRRLAAVFFADIVGYTGLATAREEEALKLVGILQTSSRREIERCNGRVVKFIGDAVLAEFSSAEAAVDAALAVADGFAAASALDGLQATLRVGAHLGETTFAADGDVYGDVVNMAARVQGLAEPGQVLVTDDVRRQLERRATFAFEATGARSLKGFETPVETFSVTRRYDLRTVRGDAPSARRDGGHRRRLAVLPFRLLKASDDLAYLSFGLADAVSCSLTQLPTLVVRSTSSLQRFAQDGADPMSVARQADVELVVSGTILHEGGRVRVTSQLVEGRTGSLLWTASEEATTGGLFELQDHLTNRIVEALAVPIADADRDRMGRDVSRSARAYELYLRANQISLQYGDWQKAAGLYESAVGEDPGYAPTWARLGRCYRLLGKYAGEHAEQAENLRRAEECFRRAVSLSPDLSLAHSYLAHLEVESGHGVTGMLRLLERVRMSGLAVDLLVGLVHACRYCGLNDASLAAHTKAAELDPRTLTSVPFTYLAMGRYEEAIEASAPGDVAAAHGLLLMGRRHEALERVEEMLRSSPPPALRRFSEGMLAMAEERPDDALRITSELSTRFPDPEAWYLLALHWIRLGHPTRGLDLLRGVVDGGYFPVTGLRHDAAFDPIRDEPEFGAMLERAEAGRAEALAAFVAAAGETLLDCSASPGTAP